MLIIVVNNIFVQEEENKSFMSKDRRRAAIKFKLHRLEDTIAKTKKDREGEFS